jgi:hypothetical protein
MVVSRIGQDGQGLLRWKSVSTLLPGRRTAAVILDCGAGIGSATLFRAGLKAAIAQGYLGRLPALARDPPFA